MSQSFLASRLGLRPDELAGQTAVVTGAGRGIGREIARALARLGASVIVAELDEDGGKATARMILEGGGTALFVKTDVSDEVSVVALVEETHRAVGEVRILVNNAIFCPVITVSGMTVEAWDRVMSVNLRGTFLLSRAFLPDMILQRSGTIVNMVSTDAMPGLSAYIASKQGIVGFSQSLAIEVGHQGVRVVAFAPGMVDTPGIREVAPDLAPRLGISETEFLNVPLHVAYDGLMPAADAGAATAYLVSALADEYHGEVVDGYTVLERAGLISTSGVAEEPTAVQTADAVSLAAATATLATAAAVGPAGQVPVGQAQPALILARKLSAILLETEAEFGRLPAFARPMARRGFRAKAGLRLQDWMREADQLVTELEHDDVPDPLSLAKNLRKLMVYYEGVPAEMARFTKDAETLRQAADLTHKRVTTIRDLIAAMVG